VISRFVENLSNEQHTMELCHLPEVSKQLRYCFGSTPFILTPNWTASMNSDTARQQ
jgi:hypothetical protein